MVRFFLRSSDVCQLIANYLNSSKRLLIASPPNLKRISHKLVTQSDFMRGGRSSSNAHDHRASPFETRLEIPNGGGDAAVFSPAMIMRNLY